LNQAVFVRVLRANRVPTRLLVGHGAQSEKPGKQGEDPDLQTHVKAEFFATGIGWVDADAAVGVANAGGDPLSCLGNNSGDFVVADLDIDRKVSYFANDPPAKLGAIQNYGWWYQGSGENIRPDYHWLVKTLDARPKQ
jgi:hypothetical protein